MYVICLGFETLSIIASRNHRILSDFDSENLPSPLFLTGGRAAPPPRALPLRSRCTIAVLLLCASCRAPSMDERERSRQR